METDTAITRVGDVMLHNPRTLAADASISQARAALDNDHVHMVLLTKGRALLGTLVSTDLPAAATQGPALPWSTLVGRTVSPDASTPSVHDQLMHRGMRRVAVVDDDGTLLGLMCLKSRLTGFCSDADVGSRSRIRDDATGRVAHQDRRAEGNPRGVPARNASA